MTHIPRYSLRIPEYMNEQILIELNGLNCWPQDVSVFTVKSIFSVQALKRSQTETKITSFGRCLVVVDYGPVAFDFQIFVDWVTENH